MKAKLLVGILLSSVVALYGEPPKVPEVKEAPKVPSVKEAPKVPDVKSPPKVPEVKQSPKVPTIKEPPKIPKVPVVKESPKVPTVKEPPKVPKVVEIKQPLKVPVVKEAPKVPKVAEVKQPPKVVETKVPPKVVETKTPPKVAEVKQPAPKPAVTPKSVAPVNVSREVKPPISTESIRSTEVKPKAPVVAEESTRRNAAPRDTPGPGDDQPADGTPRDAIDDAVRRSVEREDDPSYFRQGGKEDYETIAKFVAENKGTEDRLEVALQDGKVSTEVAEGRVRDSIVIEEVVQSGDVDPDDPEVVRAKKDILEGKVVDLKQVISRAKSIGNKAVDALEGEAPIVSVPELTAKAEAAKARGDLTAMHEYYDQAIDVLKNGGRRNSPEFRAKIISEVGHGFRPREDLQRVAVVVQEGQVPSSPGNGPSSPGAPPNSNPNTGPNNGNNGPGTGPGGPNDGTGRGPGRSSNSASNNNGDSKNSDGGGKTTPADGGKEGTSEEEKGTASNISHQVVTDKDGNVISEFDVNLDTGEVVKRTDGTPNPMEAGGGDPTQLSQQTGGRLGAQEERNAVKAVGIAANGGGAAGPRNAKETSASGVLFTNEERANAARALNTATGGDVTDPTLDESTVVVTDRDLKELHLRGNGGAKGPTDSTAPAPPPEEGPLAGPGPIVGPAPRGEVSVQSQAVAPLQIAPHVNTSGAVREVHR